MSRVHIAITTGLLFVLGTGVFCVANQGSALVRQPGAYLRCMKRQLFAAMPWSNRFNLMRRTTIWFYNSGYVYEDGNGFAASALPRFHRSERKALTNELDITIDIDGLQEQ